MASSKSQSLHFRKCSFAGIVGLIIGVITLCLTPNGLSYGSSDFYFIGIILLLAVFSILLTFSRYKLTLNINTFVKRYKILLCA